ncbi:MAG: hypothetical protein K2L75_02200 [Muribaculaceae bacterium]|nr:hypothetical protein [Muribaculaceae bacterium]
MTLIILIVILILPFIFVALGMSMWAAIISWLLLIVVALAANVWYYTFTEEGREKMAERTREAARARRRMKESVLAEDNESIDYDYDLYPDTPDADDTSTVGYYDYDSDYGNGDGYDCSDGYGSDSSYGSDCGDGGGMC